MAKLWKTFDGEPFLINPRLSIINPKKGKRNMAKRKARMNVKARMARVRSFRKANPKRRRRTARRNPWPVAGIVTNPRRRRRSTSVRHTRRRARRNPGMMSLAGISLPPLKSVLFAGVGFLGVPTVEGFINGYLPVSVTTSTIGKYAVRIGTVLVLSYTAKQFVGYEEAKMIAIGGGAYVLASALGEFMPDMLPAGMHLKAYTPGMGAYVNPQAQLRGFQPQATGNLFGSNRTSGDSIQRFKRF